MRPILLLCLILAMSFRLHAAEKLNFIVVLIDDLGASDLGCFGSKYYQTPHLDRLAGEGMKFTQAYSACTVCSPSRAALMTGRYPARLHLTDWIPGEQRKDTKLLPPAWTPGLKTDEPTLARALQRQGYATGHIGKWHLGHSPTDFGFDSSVADNGLGQPRSYLSPFANPKLPDGPPGEELTGRLTAEAVRFIDANRDRPFFLYLAHFAVHQPLGGRPETIAKYRERAKTLEPQGPAAYAAMIEAVDDSIGRLRAELATLGIADRTVLLFTSDNGGLTLGKPPTTLNLGLRAGKGSAYEGGVRVPALLLWPGLTRPGAVSAAPVITMDWTATITAAAGARLGTDGLDLRATIREGASPERPLFWHYPHYHTGGATPYSAVREGDWVLRHFYEDHRSELYHLSDDPAEATDLASKEPARTKAMLDRLAAWRTEVDAQLPLPNPNPNPNSPR